MMQLARIAARRTGIRLSGGTEVSFANRVRNKPEPVLPASDPTDLLYDPNAPAGFRNLGDMLSYYVRRNRPTWRMADYAPEMGLIAVEAYWVALFVPLASAYFYLHHSLVPQHWYFVYRYLYKNQQPPAAEMGPALSLEDAAAQDFEYVLIQPDVNQKAARSPILSILPPLENPNVVAVTQGKPAVVYARG